MKNTDVEVHLSWPISNQRDDRYGNLTIRDSSSGITFVQIELSADNLLSLMSGSGAEVTAEIVETDIYSRVGKQYVMGRIEFPNGLTTHYRDVTPEMKEFAAAAVAEGGWEGSRWTRHNYGWGLLGFRYESEAAS